MLFMYPPLGCTCNGNRLQPVTVQLIHRLMIWHQKNSINIVYYIGITTANPNQYVPLKQAMKTVALGHVHPSMFKTQNNYNTGNAPEFTYLSLNCM